MPFFFRESTISLLKSISTFSTIFIIFPSVTLNPLINLDWIFDLSNSLFILGPPPWITTIESPNLFNTLISASSLDKDLKVSAKKNKSEISKNVAEKLALKATEKNIKKIYLDRGLYKYHGRVRIFAETLRGKGIEF